MNAKNQMPLCCLLGMLFLLTACSALNTPNVPGVTQFASKCKPVRTSDVMIAIRAELGEAFRQIEDKKRDCKSKCQLQCKTQCKGLCKGLCERKCKAINDLFVLQEGSARFTGKTEVVATDSGNITAVIPINVYAGSVLNPGLVGSRSSLSSQEVTLSFAVDPDTCVSNLMGDEHKSGVKIHGALCSAVVSAFDEAVRVPLNSKDKAFDPEFRNTALDIKSSFVVVQNVEASVSSTMLIPANDLDNLIPKLSEKYKNSRTYTLSLTLPLNTPAPEPGSNRRMIFGHFAGSPVVLVDEPYSKKRHDVAMDKLLAALESAKDEKAERIADAKKRLMRERIAKVAEMDQLMKDAPNDADRVQLSANIEKVEDTFEKDLKRVIREIEDEPAKVGVFDFHPVGGSKAY